MNKDQNKLLYFPSVTVFRIRTTEEILNERKQKRIDRQKQFYQRIQDLKRKFNKE